MTAHRMLQPPGLGQIARAPELSVLSLLDNALETARASLSAAHPVLIELDTPDWRPSPELSARFAARIMRQARRLQHALAAYHAITVVSAPTRTCAGALAPGGNGAESLILRLPPLSPEQANLLHETFFALGRIVWERNEKGLADLAVRKNEAMLALEDFPGPEDDNNDSHSDPDLLF